LLFITNLGGKKKPLKAPKKKDVDYDSVSRPFI